MESNDKKSSSRRDLPLLKLIGNPEENFYQLGLKDRESYKKNVSHLESFLQTPLPFLNKIIQELLGKAFYYQWKKSSPHQKILLAYAEGLNYPPEKLLNSFLIPEILSCLGKWFPSLELKQWGCSSVFHWDPLSEKIGHLRILDFPLNGSFDVFERAILYRFKDCPQILTISSSGLPYPSLTSMTSEGVTLSLHQKFSNTLNVKGRPIFEITYDLLNSVSNLKEAKLFLKNSQSLTQWGLYLSFPDGKILEADLRGDQSFFNEYQLNEKKTVAYFNNRPIHPEKTLPYAIQNYNQMRELSFAKKLKSFLKLKKKSSNDFFHHFTTPLCTKSLTAEKWNLDIVTPSTLHSVFLSPHENRFSYISGKAPKYYCGDSEEFTNIWDYPKHSYHSKKSSIQKSQYKKGMANFLEAQVAFDQKKSHECYHKIQMAMEYLKGYPEEKLGHFYFLVYQFLFENHKKMYFYLAEEFEALKNKLPIFLQDHVELFLFRLDKMLERNPDSDSYKERLRSDELKKILNIEKMIPQSFFHHIISKLIFPRADIFEIIYLHSKI